MNQIHIILFYKFTEIDNPEEFVETWTPHSPREGFVFVYKFVQDWSGDPTALFVTPLNDFSRAILEFDPLREATK